MRATIREVATHARVSRMTVSNVLRGRDSEASPQTRERVLASVRALGYVPVTPPSKQRAHTPTRIIGLFYEEVKLDEYWGFQTSRGLHEGAIEHNYDLLTMLRSRSNHVMGEEELRFLDRRSDGFIFLAPTGQEGVLRMLVQHDIPVVTAFTDEKVEGVSSVTLDNEGAMKLAVQHVVEAGHKKLAFINWPLTRSDFRDRRSGFEKAAKACGCRPLIVNTTTPNWSEEVLQLIAQKKISAVICNSDYSAWELLRVAAENNLHAPRDFSIVGMDDIPQIASLGLTTIAYSPGEIGRRAMEAITYRLAGDEAGQCNFVVPVELRARTSVAPPKKS